jgi:hypothetical protein
MSNTSHVHLHMRVPTGLLAAVDMLAKRDLITRTSWITRALIATCELAQEGQDSASMTERLEALSARIDANLAQCRAAGRTSPW